MSLKHHRGLELSASKSFVSKKLTLFLCIRFFCAGIRFSDRMWPEPEANAESRDAVASDDRLRLVSEDCDSSKVLRLLVNVYQKLAYPDYLSICQCLMLLNESQGVESILEKLLRSESKDDALLAFQIAFDLV